MKDSNYYELLDHNDFSKIKNWSNTKEKYNKNTSLHNLFKEQAKKTPYKIAIKSSEKHINYKDLDIQSDKIASFLIYKGIKIGMRVAVCLDRSIGMITAILGILKAGAAYVPLDPKYPTDRIKYIIKDSNTQFVLSNYNHEHIFTDIDIISFNVNELEDVFILDEIKDIDSKELSHIIFTSGSTGNPKGVCINHRNVLALLHWAKKEYPAEFLKGVLCSTSICFDLSVYEIFLPLVTGGTLILVENILYINELPINTDITLINTVPSGIIELLKANAIPPTVKIVNLAGEPLRKPIVDKIYALPHIERVYNLYGPSEDTTYSTFYRIPKSFSNDPLIGKPICNTSIFVLNEEFRVLPPGDAGELYITGDGLSLGYINNDNLTKEKFLLNPLKELNSHKYIYKTGDIGRYLEDGNIEYLGRIDNQIKIRGHRVELEEIELVLSQYSTILEQVIIKDITHSGNVSICAYISLNDNISSKNIKHEIIKYAKSKLPDYMIPDYIYIIKQFPLLPNGKIDRKNLPLPKKIVSENKITKRKFTSTEKSVMNIYKDLLNLKKLNYLDNLFKLGGHSLLVLQIISRVRDELNIELKISDVLNNPVIKDLSQLIDGYKQEKKVNLNFEKYEIKNRNELSYEQNSLWNYDKLYLGSPQFNIVKSFNFRGEINQTLLMESITFIIKNHKLLMANFIEENSQVFIRHREEYNDFTFIDNSQLSINEAEKLQKKLLSKEAAYKFNLAKDQLFRIYLIKFDNRHYNITINIHHIISDRWSIDILLNDILERYHSNYTLKNQFYYHDYVHWQKNHLSDEEFLYQKQYWKEKLHDGDYFVTLPNDLSRPKYKTFNGGSVSITIPTETRDKIKGISEQYKTTNFTVLLSIFIALLTRITGKNDMVVGIPSSTRSRMEFESILGYFINVLPIRFITQSETRFSELLNYVKRELLDSFDNKDIPFDVIKDAVNPKINPAFNSLFQLMFNYYEHPNNKNKLYDIQISEENIEMIYSKYDLDFILEDTENGIQGYIEYNKDVFLKETMQFFINQYKCMLDCILKDPKVKIDDILLNRSIVKRTTKLTIECSEKFLEFEKVNKGNMVVNRFNLIKSKFKNKNAIKFYNKKLTYDELDKISNDIAYNLSKLKLKVVGLYFSRDLRIIPSILGAIKSGVTYIPININWPTGTVNNIISELKINYFITNEHPDSLKHFNVDILDYRIFKERKDFNIHNEKNSIAYILYTSGTTGKPKGVIQSQNNLYKHISNYTNSIKINSDDNLLLLSSFEFDAAIMDIFGSILNGASLFILDIKRTPFQEIIKYINKVKITILHTTPTLYRYLITNTDKQNLTSIRAVVLGGEEVKAHDFELYKNKFSQSCFFINGLGPTECTISIQNILNKNNIIEYPNVPIGYPVDGIEVMLINENKVSEHFGEIVLKGEQLALGYVNDENNKSFNKEKGLYFTGDMARYLPDGKLQFLGRKDNQIKVRGQKIDLNQIEQKLLNINGILKTVVNFNDISGNISIFAFVITSDPDLESIEIREELRLTLPNYMVPNKIIIIEKFPITNSGKIDYVRLKQMANQKKEVVKEDFLNPIEEKVYKIWEDNLENIDFNIPLTIDLFEVGGHSINAMQILWDINEYYEINIPFHYIFEYSTIRSLSKLVSEFRGKVES